jgi:hypothetical protein
MTTNTDAVPTEAEISAACAAYTKSSGTLRGVIRDVLIAARKVHADHIADCKMVAGEVSEADVIQTCEVHGFPLDPEQLEVVTAVVNQILLSASKPDAQNDGRCPHCHAISHYVECPSCGMDSDAAAPAQSSEPVYAYIYEYETAFGLHRQLEPGTYNGSNPTRTVKVYAVPQPSPTAVVLDDERAAFEPTLERTGVGEYCQPGDRREPRWIVMYDDADRSHSVFEDEQDARDCFAGSEGMGWNCWLFSPTPRISAASPQAAQTERALTFAPLYKKLMRGDVDVCEAYLRLKVVGNCPTQEEFCTALEALLVIGDKNG